MGRFRTVFGQYSRKCSIIIVVSFFVSFCFRFMQLQECRVLHPLLALLAMKTHSANGRRRRKLPIALSSPDYSSSSGEKAPLRLQAYRRRKLSAPPPHHARGGSCAGCTLVTEMCTSGSSFQTKPRANENALVRQSVANHGARFLRFVHHLLSRRKFEVAQVNVAYAY
jgi:hypothetical protein